MSRKTKFFGLFITLILMIGGGFSLVIAATSDEERALLEQQLVELEGQIAAYEGTVSVYKSQGKTLQSEINRLNANIKKINLQIKASEMTIDNLENEIEDNKSQVVITEDTLNFNKNALATALQSIYESESVGLFEIILRDFRLSNFISDLNNFVTLQDSLRSTVQKVAGLKEELLDEQEQLSLKKDDAEKMKAYHASQKGSLQATTKEKNNILAVTKGQESLYQTLLSESKKSAAQIRSRIFEFLGGGELSFEEAYKLAKVAESATGVRAALILAVLDRESALGANVGRCKYDQVNSRTGKVTMHPTRDVPLFLALVSALGIGPDSIMVSCANNDGAYGGAMGPAQFIPSTWNLYSKRVGDITGSNPPSPWRNSDAFVATALYLKDAGVYRGASEAEERKAAARYYAGSRWSRYLWTYGDRVVTKARQFERDISILNN